MTPSWGLPISVAPHTHKHCSCNKPAALKQKSTFFCAFIRTNEEKKRDGVTNSPLRLVYERSQQITVHNSRSQAAAAAVAAICRLEQASHF